MAPRLPYPGLRSFRRDEADLFFGRDDEIDKLIARLAANRFLGVLGASGSGKSSLVRTGLFEALDGGLGGLGSRWHIADCHPGDNPIANLAKALSQACRRDSDPPPPEEVETWLRRGPRSIIEWCQTGNLEPGWRLLILVDQFEELFNHNSVAAREDAYAFSSLLVESVKDDSVPIYVVLTMRSDYFGACGAYPALAEAISDSLFLTPRMVREACYEAIVGPSTVAGFDIAEDLMTTLLNDMERFAPFQGTKDRERAEAARQADQLPLMQYVLNRMWQAASDRSKGRVKLRLKDYTDIKGISGALNTHGDHILATQGLTEAHVEKVFRALVRGPSVALATRDPHTISQIAEISGLDVEGVIKIVAEFASDDCLFLRVDRPITAQSSVDINHESLIRQWDKLAEWLKNEAAAAESWRNLAVAAAEWHAAGKPPQVLLRDIILERRRTWMAEHKPTEAWVARYHVDNGVVLTADLATVKAFLDAGEAQRLAEGRKALRRRRNLQAMGTAAVALLVGMTATAAILQTQRANEIQKSLNLKNQLVEGQKINALKQRTLLDEANKQKNNAETQRIKAEKSLKIQRETTEKMTLLAVREQAARKIAENAIDSRLNDMEVTQAQIGHPLINSIKSANDAADLLGLNTNDTRPRDPERAARLIASASIVIGRSVGVNTPTRDAAESMKNFAPRIRKYSASPALISKSHILEGQAAELRQDYPAALAAYERALAVDRSLGSDSAMDAATALIRLHRRIDMISRADEVADQCLAHSRAGQSLSARTCEAAAAELRLDEKRSETALAILNRLEEDLEQESQIEVASGEPPDQTFARLKFKIVVAVLKARADPDTADIDDKLLRDAQRHVEANPNTEEAADLYASALEADGEDDDAYDIRSRLLVSEETTTGFLLDSVPLLLRLESGDESGEDSVLPPGFVGDKAAIEGVKSSLRLLELLNRLTQRQAPEIALAYDRPELSLPRAKLIEDVQTRLDRRAKVATQRIKVAAEENDLLADLKLNDRTYVGAKDRQQISRALDFFKDYRAMCEQGNDETPACISYWREAENTLKPFIDRFGTEFEEQNRSPKLSKATRGLASGAAPQSEPLFGGYDLVAYHTMLPGESKVRAVRGSEDFPLAFQGQTLFFATEANRAAFAATPEQYLPAFGGKAADWLRIGESKSGNPRLFCAHAGRIFLFESLSEASRCASAADRTQLVAEIDMAGKTMGLDRQSVERGRLEFISPAPGAFPQAVGSDLVFTLTPGQPIITPAGGNLQYFSNGVMIQHSDGSTSELRLSGGTFDRISNIPLPFLRSRVELVPRGKILTYNSTNLTQVLTWRIRRVNADGKTEYPSMQEVFSGSLNQLPATKE